MDERAFEHLRIYEENRVDYAHMRKTEPLESVEVAEISFGDGNFGRKAVGKIYYVAGRAINPDRIIISETITLENRTLDEARFFLIEELKYYKVLKSNNS